MTDALKQEEGQSNCASADLKHHKGVVIYTDGSARPNPGNIGWGVHGFLYTTEPTARGSGLSSQLLTKQGYVPFSQKGKADLAIVHPIEYYDFFGAGEITASNNAAEVDALYYALEKLKTADVEVIQVYTDSEYLRRGLNEWVHQWADRNWRREDGSPIPNAFHWKRLLDEFNTVKARGIKLTIDWVKGHSDNFGNIIADKLATIAVLYSMDQVRHSECQVSPAQGYWKSEVERHPFIHFKRMYFNSTPEFNVSGQYYIAEPGGDDFVVGKKLPETSFSVVKLKEPDRVIEVVKSCQFEAANAINAIMFMRLEKVYSPDVFPYIEQHGKYALLQSARSSLGLSFLDKTPVTLEINPSGQSLRAIESFGFLEELLERFEHLDAGIEDPSIERTCFEAHDITDRFYLREERIKKKETVIECKLNPQFGVGFKDLMVDIHIDHEGTPCAVKVPLILGGDLPPRNSLKRIETLSPKVTLLTWKEAKQSVRFACVVEVTSGIGIWSNFFADRIFLR